MIDLYNETWSEEGAISIEEFARRIELVDVLLARTFNDMHLYFTDGEMEMFGGHGIDIWFGPDRRISYAHLVG
jgi:hypothetical protein